MRVDDAIAQIAEIHQHLERNEVFRGYRATPALISSLTALFGGALQPSLVSEAWHFVVFWGCIAMLNLLVGGVDILHHYRRDTVHRRRQARRTLVQLLPSLVVGLLITLIVLFQGNALIPWLPGLWTLLFSLGLLAARPNLPRAIGWVACFYLLAGSTLLLFAGDGGSLHPWGMGLTYGLGQLAMAWVLYRNVERDRHDD